jgi:hypothetical protein
VPSAAANHGQRWRSWASQGTPGRTANSRLEQPSELGSPLPRPFIVHAAPPASTAPSASLRDGLTATVDPGTATSKAARTRERGRCGRVPATCPIRARSPAVRAGPHRYSPPKRPPTPAAGQQKLAFQALQGDICKLPGRSRIRAAGVRVWPGCNSGGNRWRPPATSRGYGGAATGAEPAAITAITG